MTRAMGLGISVAAALAGCGDDGEATGGETTATETSAGSGSSVDSTGGDPDPGEALAFLPRIAGLWAGPVDSMTSAGDFPTMNMDVRAADANTLFCRSDLDGGNSLRFAFALEHHGDADVLVFRNGGYFQGILRDTRTTLVEADVAAERWRFCAISGGCAYVDATFDFDGADHLDLHVDVMTMVHFDWPADRAETRSLPEPFPAEPQGQPGDQPFPTLPSLRASASWSEPLAEPTRVWLVLSSTPCLGGACTPSRFVSAAAEAGATSVEILLEQVHAGEYRANGVLDRNGNLATTLFPDAGDTISPPDQAVTIAPSGESELPLVLAIDL
jgi:hypothetical protein